jgi:hypothetical protein
MKFVLKCDLETESTDVDHNEHGPIPSPNRQLDYQQTAAFDF